jgi:prepilin peptidase CpaA
MPDSLLLNAVLCALLLGAVRSDIRRLRIPNRLVFYGAATGLLFNCMLPAAPGFWQALAGLGMGLAIMLPLYLMRAIGAGDVKLMAMVGAWLGANAMPGVACSTFILGGVLTLMVVARNRTLPRLLANLRNMLLTIFFKMTMHEMPTLDAGLPVSAGKMPYGVAIAAGAVTYLVLAAAGYMELFQLF